MANRFKASLNQEAESIQREEEQQVKLHRKHKDVDKDKIIIERSPFDTFMSVLGNVIRVLLLIVVGILAVIGILSLIMPDSRNALLDLWINTIGELRRYLGG